MKGYRWQKWGCILFLVSMVIIGYSAIPLPGNEIFPFYSWTMFSVVPAQEDVYIIELKEFRGKVLNPPVDFQHAGDMVTNQKSIVAFRDIQNLGLAYEAKDQSKLEKLRQLFEKNYLHPDTTYELLRTSYDPLIRWKSGQTTTVSLSSWRFGP